MNFMLPSRDSGCKGTAFSLIISMFAKIFPKKLIIINIKRQKNPLTIARG